MFVIVLSLQNFIQVQDIIGEMRKGFDEEIESLDWIDANAKQAVSNDLNKMFNGIGYPNFTMNFTELDAHYEYLGMSNVDYCGNILAMETEDEKCRLNEMEYTSPLPSFIEDFYNHYYNETKTLGIIFDLIMRGPHLQRGERQNINYGAYGSVIGHQITPGYDDLGKNWDVSIKSNNGFH